MIERGFVLSVKLNSKMLGNLLAFFVNYFYWLLVLNLFLSSYDLVCSYLINESGFQALPL